MDFHKFPRTSHIYNLGSATRDDLLLDKQDIELFLSKEITIEEKIDGANLGLRMNDDYLIECQNRSKIVNSSTQSQFSNLDTWIKNNYTDLFLILENKNLILFGEWMQAKHSIFYDNLPGYFIAFDIYDINEKQFYSRSKFSEILEQTSIPIINVLFKGVIGSKDNLLKLLKTESKYANQNIEGLYLRIDKDDVLESRSKLVSAEFIQGIEEHWSSKTMIKNITKY
jgi:hypothetical protein